MTDLSAGAMSFAHLPDRGGYFWIEQNLGGGWIGRVDFTPLTGTYAKIHALTFKFEEAFLKVYNEGESPLWFAVSRRF